MTPQHHPLALSLERSRVVRALLDEQVDGYQVGLRALGLLHDHFPAFYQAHVAGKPCTPRRLCGIAEAFCNLVDQQKLPLCFPLELDPVPAAQLSLLIEQPTLAHWWADEDSDPLLSLSYALFGLTQPMPMLYGVGLQTLWESDELDVPALTIALWHLFADTHWGLGIDLAALHQQQRLGGDRALLDRLLALPVLPAETPVIALAYAVRLPRTWHAPRSPVPVAELLSWPFARAENLLANVTWYEIETVYGGETDFQWDDLDELGQQVAEARALYEAYHAWAAAMERAGAQAFVKLARLLHRIARALLEHPPESRSTRLVDLLADDHEADEVEVTEL
jgi:hypothetical protein